MIHGRIEAVLREIEYWHQGSIAAFKIMYRDEHGVWDGVRWNGKTASFFAIRETDEEKAIGKLMSMSFQALNKAIDREAFNEGDKCSLLHLRGV